MSKLKSFDEFVNENLVTKGTYNFYGPGSLNPIVKKLIGEGKDKSIIATYLTSLGVEAWRIEKAFEELSEVEIAIVSKNEINEAKKPSKAKFEDVANKFLEKLEEEDEVSEELKGHAKKMKDDGVSDEEIKKMHPEVKDEDLKEAKKKTFEDAANAFLLSLTGSDAINDDEDKAKVEEKLNKTTLQVEGDGEDIDDMIDDLEDGDEDEDQGPDDNAPDSDVEKKIKDGESPADAAEGDSDSDNAKDKIKDAAEELAKDSEKLDKIKKVLGETKEVELENGKEVEDKEDIEDEETGDDIQVEEESVKTDDYMNAVTEGLKHRFRK